MKAYIAGPLFSQHERDWLQHIDSICFDRNIETFLPHRDIGEATTGPINEDNMQIVWSDKKGIEECDFMIATLDGQDVDSGTSWEMGYAYALKKPIIGLYTDVIRRQYFNLMIKFSCTRIVTSLDALKDILGSVTKFVLEDSTTVKVKESKGYVTY